MFQTTFSMIKPDGVAKGLIDEIKERIQDSGLTIVNSKLINMTEEQDAELYRSEEHTV